MFTIEELKNISTLINLSKITGAEAMTVALLQQKIASLISLHQTPKNEDNKEKKSKSAK